MTSGNSVIDIFASLQRLEKEWERDKIQDEPNDEE